MKTLFKVYERVYYDLTDEVTISEHYHESTQELWPLHVIGLGSLISPLTLSRLINKALTNIDLAGQGNSATLCMPHVKQGTDSTQKLTTKR